MTITEMKNTVLKLINSYSENGVVTSQLDNADFVNKINSYANECQMELARLGYNKACFTFTQAKDVSGTKVYVKKPLPTDFLDMMDNGVRLNNMVFKYFTLNGRDSILYSNEYDGSFEIYYHKRPTEINSTTSDTSELEIDKDMHSVIPYYVAALILLEESPKASQELMSIYQAKIGLLIKNDNEERKLEQNEPIASQRKHPTITR